MTNFNLSPLFRSTVGFDRLFDLLDSSNSQNSGGYPPYNIEVIEENRYQITMAVAGFNDNDLNITSHENKLEVSGKIEEQEGERHYLHKGIANRAFKQTFQLADHITVNDARLEHGMLYIDLVREVPEAMKPRTIEIGNTKKKSLGKKA